MSQPMSEPQSATTSAAEARLAEMTAKMAARETEIRRRMEELRASRAEGKSEAEKYTAFEAAFDAERLAIVEDMEALESASGGVGASTVETNNRLAGINERIANLQRYHSDSVAFLPPYISASAKSKVEELAGRLAALRERIVPKKKFAFSSSSSSTARTAAKPQQPQQQKQQLKQPELQPTLTNLTGETVSLPEESTSAKDILISNLDNCTVKLLSHPATLHLDGLTNCTIVSGPVHSSVFIEHCTGCTFYVAGHQLRLHSSNGCKLYLHATSNPILEDCSSILVAPYSLTYPSLQDHVKQSGLNWERNLWDRFQDFNHLASHVASPNWSTMPEADRSSWKE